MRAEKEIIDELSIVFRNVFKNDTIYLTPSTSSSDIEEWDSLHNAMLISAIEKHFLIKFRFAEILNFKTIGNICDAVAGKLNQPG